MKTLASLLILINLLVGGQATLVSCEQDDSSGITQSEKQTITVDNDPKRLVVACNDTVCDKLQFDWPQESGQASLVQSSEDGQRFRTTHLDVEDPSSSSTTTKIRVNLGSRHQKILGWGGAFTDAATMVIGTINEGAGYNLLKSYFGIDGLQYNFGRVPIAGTDFSTRAYSYADSDEPDYNLTKWRLQKEDLKYKIPAILTSMHMTRRYDVQLKLFSSPWSPPKWMKTSNSFVRGRLIDDDRVYESYADYLIKFYTAYQSHGIEFWGATLQNEPIAANLPVYFFNSMQMSASESIKFITNYLGPKLRARGYTRDNFKLMIGDDSLGFIDFQVPQMLANEEVRRYVAGIAFHWYTSGTIVSYDSLSKIYNSVKDHIEFVMMSEACHGGLPFTKHVIIGSWDRAQGYAEDIINDLHRHTSAWIDWNLALDMEGGPNWSGNFVDSPILVDFEKQEFYKQPMFFALAHFSRFFKEGTIRVGTKVKEPGFNFFKHVLAVAVHNEETGHVIVNVLNKADKRSTIELSITNGTFQVLPTRTYTVQPRSISSFVVKL